MATIKLQVWNEYRKGASTIEIAEKLNMSRGRAAKILKEFGIVLKKGPNTRKKIGV